MKPYAGDVVFEPSGVKVGRVDKVVYLDENKYEVTLVGGDVCYVGYDPQRNRWEVPAKVPVAKPVAKAPAVKAVPVAKSQEYPVQSAPPEVAEAMHNHADDIIEHNRPDDEA